MILVHSIHSNTHKKECIKKLIPLFLIIMTQVLQVNLIIFNHFPLLLIVLSIVVYAFVSAKFIIMNMSKSEFHVFDFDVLCYFITIVICCVTNDIVLSGYALIIYSIFLVSKYIRFMFSVINQIMNHLEISF